jgi:hypothetical protein
MLFDYLKGETSPEETAAVEAHVSGCPSCRGDLRMLREAVGLLPRKETLPSAERDGEFWSSFASGVEERILAGKKSRTSFLDGAAERISSFIHYNTRELLAGCGTLAAAAVAVLLLRGTPPPEPGPPVQSYAQRGVSLEPAAGQLHNYLDKSRVLLVGVSNLRTDGSAPIDLSVERRQSRQLVHEARDLKKQTLDARSARLVGDLEKILIELANSDERHDAPNVEIVRSGIRHNNLLFKIRMTESALAAANYERELR